MSLSDAEIRRVLAGSHTKRKRPRERRQSAGKGRPSKGASAVRAGKEGEREAVQKWKRYGWVGAHRQPGSGNLRGVRQDWAGDIGGVEPWAPVEVKRDKRLLRPGIRSRYPGESFIRGVLADLDRAWRDRHAIVGGEPTWPAAMMRAPASGRVITWRYFLPEHTFRQFLGLPTPEGEWPGHYPTWVEVPEGVFFQMAQPPGV